MVVTCPSTQIRPHPSLRGNAFITMVETAELGDLDDSPHTQGRARKWTLLVETQMGLRSVVVREMRIQGPLEMPGVQDHEMVQAVFSYGADQAFGVRILPGTLGDGEYFLNVQGRDPQTDFVAVDAGIMANHGVRQDLDGGPCIRKPDSG